HRGMHALSAFSLAAQDQGFTVFVDLDGRRAAVVVAEMSLTADVNGAGYAKPVIECLVGALALPIDHLFDPVEALFELATGDSIAVRRDVPDFSVVDAGELQRIDTEGMGA